MAHEFINNIEEANKQLAQAKLDLETAKASLNNMVPKADLETANAEVAKEKKRADDATSAATTAATTAADAIKAKDGEIAKLNSDLTVAKNASVTGAAAAGVPAVAGVQETPGKKATDGKTGLARASASFADMQPRKRQ